MKSSLIFVGLALLATVASAQSRTRAIASLDTVRCISGELGNKSFRITDGASATDCSVGGGDYAVDCVCDGGLYRPINVSAIDGSQLFASLSGAPSGQTIPGFTGTDKPRLELGIIGGQWPSYFAKLVGDGRNAAYFYVGEGGAEIKSHDRASSVVVSDGQVEIKATNGFIALEVNTGSRLAVSTDGYFGGELGVNIRAASTLPECNTTIAPAGSVTLMWDLSGPDLCVCVNGATSWVPTDGAGTCL